MASSTIAHRSSLSTTITLQILSPLLITMCTLLHENAWKLWIDTTQLWVWDWLLWANTMGWCLVTNDMVVTLIWQPLLVTIDMYLYCGNCYNMFPGGTSRSRVWTPPKRHARELCANASCKVYRASALLKRVLGWIILRFVNHFLHHLVEQIDPQSTIVIGQSWCSSWNILASFFHYIINGQSGAMLYLMPHMINHF